MKCTAFWKVFLHDRNKGDQKFHIDIQLFADEGESKTEKATARKRQEARKRGHVLQSREIGSALVVLFVLLSLKLSGSFIYSELHGFASKTINMYTQIDSLYNGAALTRLFTEAVMVMGKVMLPVFGVAVITGVISSYVQVGFNLNREALLFKPERLNPVNGFKRIFSVRGAFELVKALLKIAVIAYIAYSCLNSETVHVIKTMKMDVTVAAAYIVHATIKAGITISVVMLLIAAVDYLYQWWQYEKDLRMSKREIKEEYKQTEGNPQIRQRIKQKQRQLSMSRMLHEVPEADVVITNPTHYAVAVRYNSDTDNAPVVVGKGLDYLALRIKEVAGENNIAVVENKPLARSLYNMTETGDEIPEELFQAVAEVLAYVYRLDRNRV